MKTFLLHQLGDKHFRYVVSKSCLNDIIFTSRNIHITFDDGYLNLYEYINNLEKVDRISQITLFIVADKVGKKNDWDSEGELKDNILMDWNHIIDLSRLGVNIGSHSFSHLDLRCLEDKFLMKEVSFSKSVIEDKIGKAVTMFAYPYGLFDKRVIQFVKAAGYKEAYTAYDSILQGLGDPFRKRRIEIRGTDPQWLVKMKISGLYDLKAIGELPKLMYQKARCLRSGR